MLYVCLDKIIVVTRQQFFIQPQKAWQEGLSGWGKAGVTSWHWAPKTSDTAGFSAVYSYLEYGRVQLPRAASGWLQSAPPRLSYSCYTWTRAVSSLFACLVRFCAQCLPLFGYTNLSEWESWIERQQNKVISKQYTLKVWEKFYLLQSRSVISSRLPLTKVHFFASGLESKVRP